MNFAAAPSRFLRYRRARHVAIAVLVMLSIGSLALSPLHSTVERVARVAPWTGGVLLVSEALFVAGLAIIAWPASVHLGWNPLRWHQQLGTLLDSGLAPTATFWIGLVVNTIGAAGSAIAVLVAVLLGLPRSAWGLVLLPLGDLAITVGVRGAVVAGARSANKQRSAEDSEPFDAPRVAD